MSDDRVKKCKDCGKVLVYVETGFCNDACKLRHTLTMLKYNIDPDTGGELTNKKKQKIVAEICRKRGISINDLIK